MCYNNCAYEVFNPMTGDCKCTKKMGPCPSDGHTCVSCGVSISEEQFYETEYEYDGALCFDCVTDRENDEV